MNTGQPSTYGATSDWLKAVMSNHPVACAGLIVLLVIVVLVLWYKLHKANAAKSTMCSGGCEGQMRYPPGNPPMWQLGSIPTQAAMARPEMPIQSARLAGNGDTRSDSLDLLGRSDLSQSGELHRENMTASACAGWDPAAVAEGHALAQLGASGYENSSVGGSDNRLRHVVNEASASGRGRDGFSSESYL